MTPAQLRLLLLTSGLELVNAAIARLDRHGLSATRPELVSPELRSVIAQRDALVRDLHAARGRVIAEG